MKGSLQVQLRSRGDSSTDDNCSEDSGLKAEMQTMKKRLPHNDQYNIAIIFGSRLDRARRSFGRNKGESAKPGIMYRNHLQQQRIKHWGIQTFQHPIKSQILVDKSLKLSPRQRHVETEDDRVCEECCHEGHVNGSAHGLPGHHGLNSPSDQENGVTQRYSYTQTPCDPCCFALTGVQCFVQLVPL